MLLYKLVNKCIIKNHYVVSTYTNKIARDFVAILIDNMVEYELGIPTTLYYPPGLFLETHFDTICGLKPEQSTNLLSYYKQLGGKIYDNDYVILIANCQNGMIGLIPNVNTSR